MLYPHSKQPRSIVRLAAPALATVLIVYLLAGNPSVPRVLTDVSHTAASPFWATQRSLTAMVVATYESLEGTEALLAENMALHAEVSSLRREAYMARIQQRELEQLQAQLGVRGASSTAVTVASVLHASPTRFQDSFVIDRGNDHGVQDATLVISPEGIVYGSVVRTFSQTALVQTFSYPGRVTDTVVQGTTTLHLQVEGRGGGTMQVQVPRDIELSVGTPVLLPSMTTRPIGDVVEIRTRPEDAYQTVYIQAPFNARELRYVQVDGETVWQPTPTVEEALVPYGEG